MRSYSKLRSGVKVVIIANGNNAKVVKYDILPICLGDFLTCAKYIDLDKGEFIAPESGIYQFYFQTTTGDDGHYKQTIHRIVAVKNDIEVTVAHNQFRDWNDNSFVFFQFILDLKAGDVVKVKLTRGAIFVTSYWGYTKFGGELVKLL